MHLKKPFYLLILFSISVAAFGEPYIPDSNEEVLEVLPRGLVAGQGELSVLRQRLQEQSQDADTAIALAKQYLQLANSTGDPRYWGYAQAALSPWWKQSNPPGEILYLRAKLQEKQHAFDDAIEGYKSFSEKRPRNLQARLDLANVYRVQGRYVEALAACAPLQKIASSRILDVCRNPVRMVTGEAEKAYKSIQEMARWASLSAPALEASNKVLMGEIATALGWTEQADKDFRAALSLAPYDLYLRRVYADYLLDQNQPQAALDVLKDYTQDNGALLRVAIAADQIKQQPNEYVDELQRRFDEIRLRGESPHGRYEARFELELRHNPEKALQLARANWARQKETRDTRNLLAAALAAKNPKAAQPAIAFLRRNKTEDVTLLRLVKALQAL